MEKLPRVIVQALEEAQTTTHLILAHHRLQSLPDQLMHLTELRVLDLSYNALETLPEFIFELPQLEVLILDHNPLGVLPESLGRARKLRSLSLVDVRLRTLPETIGALHQLENLTLDDNYISRLPERLAELTHLRRLSLNHNLLKVLPSLLCALPALQVLLLERCGLSDWSDAIPQWLTLEELDLSKNRLARLPDGLESWRALKVLYARENQLQALPDSLGELRALETLDVGQNALTSLPESLGRLSTLRILRADHNALTTLPASIGQLKALQVLDLSANQLTRLPASLADLESLQQLNLESNHLVLLPDEIGSLKELREFNVSHNPLEALPESIGGLHKLERFACSATKLSGLPRCIGRLNQLRSLDLSQNEYLTALPGEIGDLEHLELLDISKCAITIIPQAFRHLTALHILRAQRTPLQWLPADMNHSVIKGVDWHAPNLVRSYRWVADPPVDPRQRTSFGRTPLHTVAQAAIPPDLAVRLAQVLLLRGADPNAQDVWGYAPLHEAALQGNLEMVRLLLASGANPALRVGDGPQKGATALDLASYETRRTSFEYELQAYQEIIALLRPVSPPLTSPITEWWLKVLRSPHLDKSASKKSFLYGRGGDLRHPRWVCLESLCRGFGLPIRDYIVPTLKHWQGPYPAEEGCLVCHSHDVVVVYSEGVFESEDIYLDCEAFCNACGWHSQWNYDE